MLRRQVTVRAAAHLAAMAALAGSVVLAVGGGWSPQHAHLDLDSGLLVSTRTEFRACVELSPPVIARQDAVLAELRTGLDQVRRHRDWEPAGLGAGRPAISVGCPDAGLVSRLSGGDFGVTEEPSPYRMWIFVLDGQTADRVLGAGVDAGHAPAERMDAGERRAAEVSTAVLVREGRLSDPAFVGGELTAAAGLGRFPEAEGVSGGSK